MSIKEYEESNKLLICPKCGLKEQHLRVFGTSVLNFKGAGWTEKRKNNSTSSIKDKSIELKEEAKNTKSSEVYNTSMPKDRG